MMRYWNPIQASLQVLAEERKENQKGMHQQHLLEEWRVSVTPILIRCTIGCSCEGLRKEVIDFVEVVYVWLAEWIAEYRAKRPGLEVLQEQIDDFMADFDAREEQVCSQSCEAFASFEFLRE